MQTFNYNSQRYNFRPLVEQYLETQNLEHLSQVDLPVASKGQDQHSCFHKKLYSKIDDEFLNLYHDFIRNTVYVVLFGSREVLPDILYQKVPTFRVHLPNNLAVFEMHKDRDYNHNPKEINVFLPMTRAFCSNSIWIESKEDLGDYAPINARYGQFVIFDGANLTHGNKLNTTGLTRVSFDFRILDKKDYQSSDKKTVSAGKSLNIGDYWAEL